MRSADGDSRGPSCDPGRGHVARDHDPASRITISYDSLSQYAKYAKYAEYAEYAEYD